MSSPPHDRCLHQAVFVIESSLVPIKSFCRSKLWEYKFCDGARPTIRLQTLFRQQIPPPPAFNTLTIHETRYNNPPSLSYEVRDHMLIRPSETWVKTRISLPLISPPAEPAHPSLPPRVDRGMPTATAPTYRKRGTLPSCWPGGF